MENSLEIMPRGWKDRTSANMILGITIIAQLFCPLPSWNVLTLFNVCDVPLCHVQFTLARQPFCLQYHVIVRFNK
jgi:hypothetical protein